MKLVMLMLMLMLSVLNPMLQEDKVGYRRHRAKHRRSIAIGNVQSQTCSTSATASAAERVTRFGSGLRI